MVNVVLREIEVNVQLMSIKDGKQKYCSASDSLMISQVLEILCSIHLKKRAELKRNCCFASYYIQFMNKSVDWIRRNETILTCL